MNETTDATAIFAPIWRRKWLILSVGVIVAAGSYFYYKREHATYQAATQMYLGAGAEEQAPVKRERQSAQPSLVRPGGGDQHDRRRTGTPTPRSRNKGKLMRNAKVKAKAPEKSEFITITTEARGEKCCGAACEPHRAGRTSGAASSASRRAIEKAIAIARRQLRRIEAAALAEAEAPSKKTRAGASGGSAQLGCGRFAECLEGDPGSEPQLEDQPARIKPRAVSASRSSRQSPTAALLSPKPRKNAIFGFVIGIVLAAIAAYALEPVRPPAASSAGIERRSRSQRARGDCQKVRRPIVMTRTGDAGALTASARAAAAAAHGLQLRRRARLGVHGPRR